MEVILLGMVIDVKLGHSLKAYSSIDMTPFSIVTEAKRGQYVKVEDLISEILLGIIIEVRYLQL